MDVGAKAEIHALIGELAAQGAAILLISSELPEVLSLSTRILVLRAGRLVAELTAAEARRRTAASPHGRSRDDSNRAIAAVRQPPFRRPLTREAAEPTVSVTLSPCNFTNPRF